MFKATKQMLQLQSFAQWVLWPSPIFTPKNNPLQHVFFIHSFACILAKLMSSEDDS